MRLSALAGLVMGFVVGAAVAVACTMNSQRRANTERDVGTKAEEDEGAGEAPESAAGTQPASPMH